MGLSLLRASNGTDAAKTFDAILDRKPEGHLSVSAAIGTAAALELNGNSAAAAEIYAGLSTHKSISPEDILARLARASQAAGDRPRAAQAWLRVYYEFPLCEQAKAASDALAGLQDLITKIDYKRDLGRALILFGSKRYSDAQSALVDLAARGDSPATTRKSSICASPSATISERHAAVRDGVQPYLTTASRRASQFYLSAIRGLGDADESTCSHARAGRRASRQQLVERGANNPARADLTDDDDSRRRRSRLHESRQARTPNAPRELTAGALHDATTPKRCACSSAAATFLV